MASYPNRYRQAARTEPRSGAEREENITVDSDRMGLYDRFLHETRWLPFSKYQLVWDFIRTIEEPPTAELKPSMLPPAESELWHEDEEPKLPEGDLQE